MVDGQTASRLKNEIKDLIRKEKVTVRQPSTRTNTIVTLFKNFFPYTYLCLKVTNSFIHNVCVIFSIILNDMSLNKPEFLHLHSCNFLASSMSSFTAIYLCCRWDVLSEMRLRLVESRSTFNCFRKKYWNGNGISLINFIYFANLRRF